MADAAVIGVILFSIIIIEAILFWQRKKVKGVEKEKSELKKVHDIPSISDFYKKFGRSALIEFTPTNRYENVTIATVHNFLEAGKNVVLLTHAPRSRMYLEGFHSFVKSGRLKVVNLTTENPLARPQMFRVAGPPDEKEPSSIETDLALVSINNLEFLTEITEEMTAGSVLLFEALTGLILALGKEKKESVYKFFSTLIEEMSEKERIMVAFLNINAHEKEIVSAYEGLFMKIFKIENGHIISLKGEKIKIPVESF
jgi:hypothetical protein